MNKRRALTLLLVFAMLTSLVLPLHAFADEDFYEDFAPDYAEEASYEDEYYEDSYEEAYFEEEPYWDAPSEEAYFEEPDAWDEEPAYTDPGFEEAEDEYAPEASDEFPADDAPAADELQPLDGAVLSDDAVFYTGEAPVFSVQPEDVYGKINKKVTLSADAGDDVTYQWQCQKTEGGAWNNIGESSSFVGATAKAMTFSVNATRLTWSFRVVAKNAVGETPSNAVHVIEGDPPAPEGDLPEFKVQPENVYGKINKKVTLSADAGDDVTYQWQCQKTEGGAWSNIGESSSFVGATAKAMTFSVTSARAAWTFRVVAKNAVGETPSNEVRIILGTVIDGVTYEPIDEQTCRVVSYSGTDASVVIPETVAGLTVTEIGASAFEGNTALVSITLPNTISVIKEKAFKNCTSLSQMNTQ